MGRRGRDDSGPLRSQGNEHLEGRFLGFLQHLKDSLGPFLDFRLVGLGLPIDFKALSDNIRAQPFKSGFDDVDGPAEVCETAVPRGETGCFVPLGIDEVELLEQRIKIVLQDDFVVAPCGTTEKDHIPSVAKPGRAGVGGIEKGGLMSGLLDKASKDFRESFRVAGRGAVNNQYFTHALLHDETVLFPYTRSFGPEKAMRTREAEKSPCVRKFLCRMPKDCFRGGDRHPAGEAGPTTSRLLCRFLGNSLTGDGGTACFLVVREKTIMKLKFFFKYKVRFFSKFLKKYNIILK